MRWAIEVIITCGKQCLLLRAHREKTPDTNSGNLLAIYRLLGETKQTLKEHMDNPIARNAQYLSPHILNDIIGIIVYDVLQRDLIDEVKKAKFFIILTDEVEGRHDEQLSICMWFVDKSNDKGEEFLEVGRCTQINGETISTEILRIIKKADLYIMNCRSQGYDRVSNMSSGVVISLYHSIREGRLRSVLIWTHKYWLQYALRKTRVLDLTAIILEKYLKKFILTCINRLFGKQGVFKSYPATLLKMKFSIGILHVFGL